MKVTLDINCIIDLEEGRPAAPFIQDLISLHKAEKINLRVTAISGAERQPDGTYPDSFMTFKQKVAATGLDVLEIFPNLAYLGMAFVGLCYTVGEETAEFERQIHEILFPTIEFDYTEYCKRLGIDPAHDEVDPRWRNAKCDVLTMWGHIRFEGDIFVTSDENFHKQSRKPRLISLGAGKILKPHEAVSFLNSITP